MTGLLLHLGEPQPALKRRELKSAAEVFRRAGAVALEFEVSGHRLLLDPDRRFQNLGPVL